MKARIINTQEEVEVQPYFNEGMFAGFADVSGRLRPGMVVYKPSDLEFIDRPAPLEPIVDWSAFRREVARAAMLGILAGRQTHQGTQETAEYAVQFADELIKQLKRTEI